MDVVSMQNLFFLTGGNNGTSQQLPGGQGANNEGSENLLGGQGDPAQQLSQQAALHQANLGSAGLFATLPLFSPQQQAAAAAQAAAAMTERSLSNFGAGAPANAFSPATLELTADATSSTAQMGAGFIPGFSTAAFENAAMPNFMDANHLLLQRLQAASAQQAHPFAAWTSLQQNPMLGGAPAATQHHDAYAENGMLGPWSSTSAGLLGKIASMDNETKKKVVRKKPKDKPKRPLSAYNIFFKEERKRILESIPSANPEQPKDQADGEKRGSKKKKTPHGKIGFENLAKAIGQRWQELEPDKAEYYKAKAAEDMKRYKDQMEVFLTKQASKKRPKQDDVAPELEAGGAFKREPEATPDFGEPVSKKIKLEDDEEAASADE